MADRPAFTWDAARLRLTWANAAGIRFWGEDSLIDLTERVFAPGDETVRAFAAREAEMAGGDAVGRITLYPQGDPVWARAECRAEQRADGRHLMRLTLHDIEAANDLALIRQRAGFDAAPRPLAIFDDKGAALVRNEADRRACPETAAALDARYVEPGLGQRALARALAEGAFSHTAMIRSAPSPLRHRISLRRMRDPATGRICVIADFTDLSDRPAAYARPGFAEEGGAASPSRPQPRTVSVEALARIAHDIRGPLGAISGFADMLRLMGDDLPEARRIGVLEDIAAACTRLSGLTDRLVALGVPEAQPAADAGPGRAQGMLTMVDLAALCDHAARLYAGAAAAAGMTLTTDVAPDAVALADADALARILDNLTRNAVTHGARQGGAVSLSAGGGTGGNPAWVAVSDDGPGLSAAALAQVLAPDSGGAPEPVLHGLGLANVMTLARDMAADATIDTAEGGGFAVRVTFAVPRPA